jgi:hypothetical protein
MPVDMNTNKVMIRRGSSDPYALMSALESTRGSAVALKLSMRNSISFVTSRDPPEIGCW